MYSEIYYYTENLPGNWTVEFTIKARIYQGSEQWNLLLKSEITRELNSGIYY